MVLLLRIFLLSQVLMKGIRPTSVGICWTLTELKYEAASVEENLGNHEVRVEENEFMLELATSLLTLRQGNAEIKTCLFTDLAESTVTMVMNQLGKGYFAKSLGVLGGEMPNFDYILESAEGEVVARGIMGEELVNATASSLNQHDSHRSGVSLWRKFKALAGRIQNLARAPFHYTLFIDTDTAFCPTPDLIELITVFGSSGHADARFVEQDASNGRFDTLHVSLAAELSVFQHCIARNSSCAQCFYNWNLDNNLYCSACYAQCEHVRGRTYTSPQAKPCDSFRDTLDLASFKPGMQIGAILVKQGSGLNAFVRQWVESYVRAFSLSDQNAALFSSSHKKIRIENFANDQQPLHKLIQKFCRGEIAQQSNPEDRWTLGQIPPNYNFRMFQPNAVGPISGRVVILHSHHLPSLEKPGPGLLTHIASACKAVNGNYLGLRLISDGELKKATGEVNLSIQPLIGKNSNPLVTNKRRRRRRSRRRRLLSSIRGRYS